MSIERGPKLATMTLAASLLLGGCSAESPEPSPRPTPSASASELTDLRFQTTPDGDFSSSNCLQNSDTWAVKIDTDPTDVEKRDFTIGFTEESTPEGRPVFVVGTAIRALGNYAYELVTSEDGLGESTIVNLNEDSYARVLHAGEDYDAVLSARLGGDGNAYISLRCLPDFNFRIEPDAPLAPSNPVAVEPNTIAI